MVKIRGDTLDRKHLLIGFLSRSDFCTTEFCLVVLGSINCTYLEKEKQQAILNNCQPHSRLLPGYNADYLQHDIGIYAQIEQAMLEGGLL